MMVANQKKIDTANFVEQQLHDLGYKAQAVSETSVASMASGLNFLVFSYGDSIQFRSRLKIDYDGKWLDFANNFNKRMRFVKVYIDDDTLCIEGDWWLDFEGGNTNKSFQKSIELWEFFLSALKEKLREELKNLREELKVASAEVTKDT